MAVTPEAETKSKSTAAKPRPKKAETAKVAKAYFDAIGRQDIDGMVAVWKPGSVDHLHGMAEMRAPEGIREWFGAAFRSFPDLKFEVLDMTVEADRAAVRWRAAGTFTGDARFEGFIANGASVVMEGLDLLTVEDGLIVENHAYTNAMEVARQLGAMPPAGSAAEKAMAGAFNMKTRAVALLKRDS